MDVSKFLNHFEISFGSISTSPSFSYKSLYSNSDQSETAGSDTSSSILDQGSLPSLIMSSSLKSWPPRRIFFSKWINDPKHFTLSHYISLLNIDRFRSRSRFKLDKFMNFCLAVIRCPP